MVGMKFHEASLNKSPVFHFLNPINAQSNIDIWLYYNIDVFTYIYYLGV